MERSDFIKIQNDAETISINRLKNKNFVPPLKIFNIRYFKTCNRIILIFIFLLILINTVLCDIVQEINSKILANNETVGISNKLVSNRSDINIFLNKSNNNHNHSDSNNNTNLCMKDHRIKERDIKEEESGKQKRKNYRNNEKEKKDEDDDVSASLNAKNEEHLKMGSNKGCNSCIMREEIRSMSLEMIKGDILSKLGMAQAPNLTGKIMPKIGEYQLTLLKQKFAIDSRQKNSYPSRRHSHHSGNKISWVSSDDETNQMQGDEPYDSDSRYDFRINYVF